MKPKIVFEEGRKNVTQELSAYEVAQSPSEGKLFEVNPLGMDRSLFLRKRKDWSQEETRKIIQEAFAEAGKHPEKYADMFFTFIPEKTWDGRKGDKELKQYAIDLGGQTADWVQQALEWAQRICNGEPWEKICNDYDTVKWHRMVIWKDGYPKAVGGSSAYQVPASFVEGTAVAFRPYRMVPLVAFKKN